MIDESKILDMIQSYEGGRDMKLDAMSISQAKEEEHIKNIDTKIDLIGGKLDSFGGRIRALEDWKLVFVAKYSVYSAIALFLGSLVAQLAIHFLSKYL